MQLEIRHLITELRADPEKPNTLVGYAAKFNALSVDLGGFVERIAPGAFTKSLSSDLDIRALIHHDPKLLLGSRAAKTLRLIQDDTGLRFEVDVPDTSYGRDILASIKRGDTRGMSFGFRMYEGGDRYDYDGPTIVRTLSSIDLREITVTSIPAYPDTEVSVRVAPGVLDQVKALQPKPALEIARRGVRSLDID